MEGLNEVQSGIRGVASADKIKVPLKSYMDHDDDQFFSISMQVAA